MEISLKNGCYKEDFVLELPEKGTLSTTNNDGRTILLVDGKETQDVSIVRGDNLTSVKPIQTIVSQMLGQGIFIQHKLSWSSEPEFYYTKNNKYLNIINKIKAIDDGYFRFAGFVSVKNNTLTVIFRGHEVSGSYVHEWKVYPYYVKTIERASLRKTRFVNYGNSNFGYASYTFEIDLNHILKKDDLEITLIKDERHFLYFLGFERSSQIGNNTIQYTWIDNTNVPEEYKNLSIFFRDVDTTYFSVVDYHPFNGCKDEDVIGKLLYLKQFMDFLSDKGLLELNNTPIGEYIENSKYDESLSYNDCNSKLWLLHPNKRNFDSINDVSRYSDWYTKSTHDKLNELKSKFVVDEYPKYLKATNKLKTQFIKKYGKYFTK